VVTDRSLTDGPKDNCPSTVPSGVCSKDVYPRTCWYGDDPRYFCRTSAVCAATGLWQVQEAMPGCTDPLPAACPPEPSTTYAGCSVDGGPDPICIYSDRFCKCRFGGGPELVWGCTIIPPGCPTLPPEEGDPCTGTTQCVYFPCSWGATCVNSLWHWSQLEC
jgi:hypothetical protein